jgi:hypothetical protein
MAATTRARKASSLSSCAAIGVAARFARLRGSNFAILRNGVVT